MYSVLMEAPVQNIAAYARLLKRRRVPPVGPINHHHPGSHRQFQGYNWFSGSCASMQLH